MLVVFDRPSIDKDCSQTLSIQRSSDWSGTCVPQADELDRDGFRGRIQVVPESVFIGRAGGGE